MQHSLHITTLLCSALLWAWPGAAAAAPAACPALLQYTLPRLQDEKPIPLCSFAGQVVVVNTASKCGYTPQYKSLETLSERYKARGLVVLGFPSNDFGGQEPGDNAAIADFCENTFAVRFPMFTKTAVKAKAGVPASPLFTALATRTGKAPGWNFHKYIVSRNGEVVISHGSDTDPLDPVFLKDVDKLLNSK